MVIVNSDDYHDYVIKNGKLIGEFEQMYKKSTDIPWRQNEEEEHLDVRLTIEMLKEYSPFDFICDFGCGLGYFLNILKSSIGRKDCSLIGYDISTTCCRKAKKNFPNFKFYKLDIMSNIAGRKREQRKKGKRLFTIRGTLWYVFPNIKDVVENISNITSKGDYLLISQNFPPLESNFVGKDVIPNFDAIVMLFSEHFVPFKTIWLEDKISKGNDNWFIGLFQRI